MWPIHLLWCGNAHRDLNRRLGVTEETIASWTLDEAAPEEVLEELHTAAELMLMRLLGKRRAPAFVELVEAARDAGHLSGPVWPAYEPFDPHRPGDMGDVLISLKDHRKRIRHQGTDEARAWLDEHFWAAGLVLEHLSDRLQAVH